MGPISIGLCPCKKFNLVTSNAYKINNFQNILLWQLNWYLQCYITYIVQPFVLHSSKHRPNVARQYKDRGPRALPGGDNVNFICLFELMACVPVNSYGNVGTLPVELLNWVTMTS